MTQPAPPPKPKRTPYRTGLLDDRSRNECTFCKNPVTVATKAWCCPLCGFMRCDADTCDPAKNPIVGVLHNDFICHNTRIASASDLVYNLLRPPIVKEIIPPPPPKPERDDMPQLDDHFSEDEAPTPLPEDNTEDDDALLMVCTLWSMSRAVQFQNSENEQGFYDRLRTPNGFWEIACAKLASEGGKEIPTLAQRGAFMRARLSPTFVGDSYMDILFGAHVLAAQPDPDTFAQLVHLFNELATIRVHAAYVFTGDLTEKQLPKQDLANALAPFRLLECYVDAQKQRYVCQNKISSYIGAFSRCVNEDFELPVVKTRPLNVVWLLHLMHCKKDEFNASMNRAPYAPVPVFDSDGKPVLDAITNQPAYTYPPRPRPASTQLMVRIMGPPDDPILFVVQMHTTLYSLDRWMQGSLFPDKEKRHAHDDHPAMLSSNFDVMFPSDARITGSEEDWFASQHKQFTVHEPQHAGSSVRQVKGKVEVHFFTSAIDTLCNPGATMKERHKAYADVTGVKWPEDKAHLLSPFILVAARANLVA